MAKYVCPCCGEAFNGKKCRNCRYETFDEEISHRLHTHKGEPLVIREPARRPKGKRDPMAFDKTTRKKSPGSSLLLWVLVFLLLEPVLVLGQWMVDEIGDAVVIRTPETIPEVSLAEDARKIYYRDGITLYLMTDPEWDATTVVMRNDTYRNVRMSAQKIVVDGYMTDRSYFYCETPTDSQTAGGMTLDMEDLAQGGITEPKQMTLWLLFYDADTYDTIYEAEPVTVTLSEGQPEPQPDLGGIPICDQDGLKADFLGYKAYEYDETFSDGIFLFYLENNTDRTVRFFTQDNRVAGKEAPVALWCEMAPNSRTVARMYLYELEDMGIDSAQKAGTFQCRLRAYDGGEPEKTLELGEFSVDLG